jgi:tetratricopeptide (TPR) repeat protein
MPLPSGLKHKFHKKENLLSKIQFHFLIFEKFIKTMYYAKILIFFCTFSVFAQTEIDKAEKLFAQKKYTEAISILEKYYKEHPNSIATIELLGDIAGQQKKWDEAIKYYAILKNSYPNNANYHYKYGGVMGMKAKENKNLKGLKMVDEVEKSFIKAAQLDPKHIEARWGLVMLYIELPAIIGGSERKAQKYADELLLLSKVEGYLAKAYIDDYFNRKTKAEANYLKAYQLEKSKKTFQKLYNFYVYKSKDAEKAKKLKEQFEK